MLRLGDSNNSSISQSHVFKIRLFLDLIHCLITSSSPLSYSRPSSQHCSHPVAPRPRPSTSILNLKSVPFFFCAFFTYPLFRTGFDSWKVSFSHLFVVSVHFVGFVSLVLIFRCPVPMPLICAFGIWFHLPFFFCHFFRLWFLRTFRFLCIPCGSLFHFLSTLPQEEPTLTTLHLGS